MSPTAKSHVLAIDAGTTGITCLVVAADGTIAGRAYREITQFFPQAGWVEHDATEIAALTVSAAREAIATSGVRPVCCGITNQRETVVLWERDTGHPIGRAIVWQDRRTADRCAALEGRSDWLAARTGLRPDPYFSATKLEYLLRDPRIARRAEQGELLAGTIDSWLVWSLTQGRAHVTDPTNASRTLLYDIDARDWSDELCALFSVPKSILPTVRPSAGEIATIPEGVLSVAMPITGLAGDQQAALFGQGCWTAGDTKNTYGTGAFLLANMGTRRPAGGGGLLTTIACDAHGAPVFALEASIFIAGAAIQWLRDGLGIIANAAETEQMARALPSNEGVYFVPALTGLGAPHWERDARGTIVGITRGTSRAHLVRAALEAMAYGTADVVELMEHTGGVSIPCLRADGGAATNDWLMQFQADVLGIPVERPAFVETTALGAAGLAGLAAGVWDRASDFLAARHASVVTPGNRDLALLGRRGWARAVAAALTWARDGR